MTMIFGSRSDLARVRSSADNGRHLVLEFRNGQVATVDSPDDTPFRVGDVVLVDVDNNRLDLGAADLWPEESWIGVVRLILDDVTVVDVDGRFKQVPTRPALGCQAGFTVEGRDLPGILRILAKEPIRHFDLPSIDTAVIETFRSVRGGDETFEDFGGLAAVVERARELIEIPLQYHAALAKIGARPIKGVLFTGPPGTGKTMLARIIANRADAHFYEISGPEIFSKWYGQSEELLREIFKDAANQHRAIIFFDEIDSVAAQRDDEAHEVSRRVVAQLLTLMDGFAADTNVVVIATTNRLQDIDVALRRPGRFDWEIDFTLPDRSDREAILKVTAKRLSTAGELPHSTIAERTEGWSGAELAAIWSEAALLAVTDGRDAIVTEDYFGGLERVAAQRVRSAPSTRSGSS